ncbi:MAG: cathepsin [Terrestrivirus sp.]|uniref:Cathepsin n=1 Tax=Terrestrivirus sp. TaxID=2487775 RepID=A0A3G4ZML7_9VIRU|nr:MAG: cathepsin [Terrestrivirus sp.]
MSNIQTALDWTIKGAVTSVKNGGMNAISNSWSFAITGMIEGYHYITKGSLKSLSEQQMIDCIKYIWNDVNSIPRGLNYVINIGGLESEASYPFTSIKGVCKFNSSSGLTTINTFVKKDNPSVSYLLEQLQISPIAVTVLVDKDFLSYESGIYYPKSHNYCDKYLTVYHMLLVGYDATINPSYFIAKLNFGTVFGNNGYMQISLDNCDDFFVRAYNVY